MNKKIILAIFVMPLLYSCSEKNYYQVYDVQSSDVSMKDGLYAYDNSDCCISYNMWSEGGNVSFMVQNKTDKNLYVLMPKSFFILNGVANDYYYETTYTRAVTNNAQLSSARQVSLGGFISNGLAWYPSHIARVYGASIGTSTTESVTTKEAQFICVPPKAAKLIYGFNISDYIYKDCDNYKFNYPSRVSPNISYTESNTPIKFRNRIAYSFEEKGSDVKYIENSFWMSNLINYSSKGALEKMKYEDCESNSKISVKNFRMSAPNKFYNIYQKNLRASKNKKD